MLNASNRCEFCGGVLHNIEGKRYTIPELTAIHDQACPGKNRRTTTK